MSDADRSPVISGLFPVLAVINISSVFLRVWSRCVTPGSNFGWDDFFATASLPFVLAYLAVVLRWIHYGLGQHVITLQPEEISPGLELFFAGVLLFATSVALPKFSVLFFYNRVFTQAHRRFRTLLRVLGVLNLLWVITLNLVQIFSCNPIRKNWDPAVPGTCADTFAWFLAFAVFSVALDVCILIAPLPLIYALQMPIRRKLLILSVFIAGYSVVAIAVARLIIIGKASYRLTDDVTYTIIPLAATAGAESTASLFGACLPPIFHLFVQIRKGGFRSVVQKKYFGRDLRSARTGSASQASRGNSTGVYRMSSNDRESLVKTSTKTSTTFGKGTDDDVFVETAVFETVDASGRSETTLTEGLEH